MSFMNPVDMVEEDAADLQFPKAEPTPTYSTTSQKIDIARPCAETKYVICVPTSKTKQLEQLNDLDQSLIDYNDSITNDADFHCAYCSCPLVEPYIKCNDCDAYLCLSCFARGRETSEHQNFHSYIIRKDDIKVFAGGGNWTAREERILLRTLQKSGYGNWSAVARALNWQRTCSECRDHYHNCYFGNIFEKLLGLQHASDAYFPQRLPYITKLRTVDPPRNDDLSSMQFEYMAGYRAARGDFDIPYDHSAEHLLTNIHEHERPNFVDDDEIEAEYIDVIEELKCALVNAYNHRLKERQRRYKIMRDHGLLVSNRTLAWISKYTEAFGNDGNCSRFLTFMQISNPLNFDLLIESMNLFSELRRSIFRLYEARQNGVSTRYGASLYFKLKAKRLQRQREQHKNQYDWKKLIQPLAQGSNVRVLNPFAFYNNIATGSQRRKPPPLDVMGLPGYTKLNDDERKLCSVERIPPEAFLDYKTILVAENTKIGQLRLADARRLIKIDVNKTRRIYDFLIEHGHIKKAS